MDISVEESLPSPVEFREAASGGYAALSIGLGVLTKTPAELVAALREMLGADESGGSIIGAIDELSAAKDWFFHCGKTLECAEARAWIAASALAVE